MVHRLKSLKWSTASFAAVIIGLLAAGCGSGETDRSTAIAQAIHADACMATNYEIIYRVTNTKTRIYDCTINGVEKCVVEENGIVNDATAEAKLLFANALSGGKPTCAT